MVSTCNSPPRALDADMVLTKRPGDLVELTVERIGEPKPLMLDGVFRARALAEGSEGLTKSSALEITGLFPTPFLFF
jgi:hypothetical protein